MLILVLPNIFSVHIYLAWFIPSYTAKKLFNPRVAVAQSVERQFCATLLTWVRRFDSRERLSFLLLLRRGIGVRKIPSSAIDTTVFRGNSVSGT